MEPFAEMSDILQPPYLNENGLTPIHTIPGQGEGPRVVFVQLKPLTEWTVPQKP